MKASKNSVEVIFRYVKKDEGEQGLAGAFDLLFDEVFRVMNQKLIVATK